MEDLKYKISLIYEDLREALCDSVLQENHLATKELKNTILLLEKYDNNQISYSDIIAILIQICIIRYDLVKAIEESGKRYAIFSIKNVWISFVIDNKEKDTTWKEIKELEKEQDKRCLEIATSSSKYLNLLSETKKEVLDTLKKFYLNPHKYKYDYIEDVLHIENIFVTPTGEYSTGEWYVNDNNYFEILPDDIRRKNRAFYLVNNPKGKKIN